MIIPARVPIPTVLALTVAALLTLAGCAQPAEPPPAELVWATGAITADGPAGAVAQLWNTAHPDGPLVRVEPLPESTDDQHQLLTLELGAGIPEFDVVDLDVIWTADFASRGWLTDLSRLRTEVEASSLPVPLQSATWQGRLWAAPWITNAGLLYYRTDLVATPPTTWSALIEAGTQPGLVPLVLDGAPAEGLVCDYLELLWGAGGEFTVDDDGAVRFDEPAATVAMDFLRTGYENGLFVPGTETMLLEDARVAFQSGRAVFMRSWPYAYPLVNGADPASLVAGRVGVAPLPTFTGTGTVAALGGHNLAVSRHSRAPEAATEFVRFVSTDLDVQRMLARDFSLAPAAAAAYDDLAADPVFATVARVLPHARTRPVTPQWTEVSEQIQQQIVVGTRGRTAPADAVATLHRLIDATAGTR